ncbi:hypothetical protein [uncultured Methylophaga sp.]|uniref:hypothetical protein n=1 Tax=uncultured Methylophaga sp. TaxID=285271 RepID=UPI00262F5086|nr:hypothetical protein [uncultured Methylophaga sp.]
MKSIKLIFNSVITALLMSQQALAAGGIDLSVIEEQEIVPTKAFEKECANVQVSGVHAIYEAINNGADETSDLIISVETMLRTPHSILSKPKQIAVVDPFDCSVKAMNSGIPEDKVFIDIFKHEPLLEFIFKNYLGEIARIQKSVSLDNLPSAYVYQRALKKVDTDDHIAASKALGVEPLICGKTSESVSLLWSDVFLALDGKALPTTEREREAHFSRRNIARRDGGLLMSTNNFPEVNGVVKIREHRHIFSCRHERDNDRFSRANEYLAKHVNESLKKLGADFRFKE